MIKTNELIYEYEGTQEEGNIAPAFRAIDGVNINVKKGEFIAVLGHNGSGKSTFAKHLNAILLPTDGVVYVDGKDTKDGEKLWEIRQTAGMVFQNPDNQIVGTVVEEDVAFGPENLGVEPELIRQRVYESLEAVGMKEYGKHSPNKLSGGQKQRVAIAGVLAMRPKCILLDEPTAMLDPSGRREVLSTLEELRKKEKITVVLITHYMEEVTKADKIYVMDKGKVVLEGTPLEVFKEVEFLKSLGLDVPQVTLLAHQLKKQGINLPEVVLEKEELVNLLCAEL